MEDEACPSPVGVHTYVHPSCPASEIGEISTLGLPSHSVLRVDIVVSGDHGLAASLCEVLWVLVGSSRRLSFGRRLRKQLNVLNGKKENQGASLVCSEMSLSPAL